LTAKKSVSTGPGQTVVTATRDRRSSVCRVLKPLVEEVGAPWAAFHAFRHTFASIHLREGTNLLQLSRALGHHSAALTLSRYTHLLPGDEAPPLDLGSSPRPAPPRARTPSATP